MQLKALFEMWIVVIYYGVGKGTDFIAILGADKPNVLPPFTGGTFYHLQAGDSVMFYNLNEVEFDPYQVVMKKYPLYFELEQVPAD